MMWETALPLLQFVPTIKKSDPRTTIIGVIVVVVFFGILLLVGGKGGGGTRSRTASRGSKRTFKRHAQARGLSKRESTLLMQIAQGANIPPLRLLQSGQSLDSALKRTFSSIETDPHPGVDKEARKLELYRIKQKLERSGGGGTGNYGSSKQIPLGQALTIQDEVGNRFQSKINGNLQKNLSLTVPVDNRGNQIRWKKWTKVKVFFWRSNGQGYSFESKVLGYNQLRGVSSLFIQHAGKIKKEQQRRYRRREMSRPAYFYPIRVLAAGSGKTMEKKAVVEHKRGTLGTINDISAGGCAMKSNYPLGTGELIKLEFETGRGSNQVVVYGKVRSLSRLRPIGGIMHIQFTRMSRKHLNRINSYVYGLEDSIAKKR
ncbi:PilZ domain-containing protein [Sediminispirochaeta bajacaliforniensis]|uniref:PilZ domain-containing protein n=1 Tax=Sediminispirochaeta bajacaliforniensis TaxID=148 RepID=UPI0003806AB1|nr:PilZ domain-containing protein [Sediminispirochaeta bajacaliforniensis]